MPDKDMPEFDLIVRGGTIADGLGGATFSGDVAIRDGKIVGVGKVRGSASRTLDADGALVTPGFIDTHSHYDGQTIWDPLVWSSSLHGTTTVVNGNCGVGFAPVQPEHHQYLIDLMESIEEIPEPVMRAGIEWKWGDFGEFLDSLRPHDIDVGFLVAHNPLRLYVMGDRALDGSAATAEDTARMGELMKRAMDSGAIGFSTSRTILHRCRNGPIPSRHAQRDELVGIARGMGQGMFQIVTAIGGDEQGQREIAHQQAVAATGVSVVIPLVAGGDGVTVAADAWKDQVAELDAMVARGHSIWAQVAPRPVGVFLGLQASMNPFSGIPAYEEIADLPVAERLRAMRTPSMRARILAGVSQPRISGKGFQGILRAEAYDQMWELIDPPDYEPHPDDCLMARAAREGCRPEELAYDLVTAGDGEALIYFAFFGYAGFSLDGARELMQHERALVGLGDGGAHVGSVCDASYPTTMLAHWARDRNRGERLDLSWVVQSMTSRPAKVYGFSDRGVLAPGFKADINIIDFDNLKMQMPRMLHDFPAGGKRLVQGADGILATIVSGQIVYENGQHTGALPGRVLRSTGAVRRNH